MTTHLEVSCRSAGEWERAIVEGYRIWRQVHSLGDGLLEVDFTRGTIVLAAARLLNCQLPFPQTRHLERYRFGELPRLSWEPSSILTTGPLTLLDPLSVCS